MRNILSLCFSLICFILNVKLIESNIPGISVNVKSKHNYISIILNSTQLKYQLARLIQLKHKYHILI